MPQYAEKYLDLQRGQFKRIGVFGRWDKPYSTMTPQYEATVLDTFYSFYEKDSCTRDCARFIGACMTRRRWRKRKLNTRTKPVPQLGEVCIARQSRKDRSCAQGQKSFDHHLHTTRDHALPMAVAFHPAEEYVAVV